MKQQYFARFAWGVLVYNIAVILWGAYVRATGSGAGCGSHWPLCNGVVVPRAPAAETMIEFTHRLTSGVALLLVVGMLIWAWRAFPRGHQVRLGAVWSMVFMVIEALVGAGLVLLGLVADNDSVARAVVMAIHLANTFLLLAALTLTAWWASGGAPLQLRGQGLAAGLLGFGMLGVLVIGMSGAVTALGDTLFPSGAVGESLRRNFSPTAHFLERLRIWHPVIAIAFGVYLIAATRVIAGMRPSVEPYTLALTVLFLVQLGVGAINVLLKAPVWMQLVHLLLADLVWIVMVLASAVALAVPGRHAAPEQPAVLRQGTEARGHTGP